MPDLSSREALLQTSRDLRADLERVIAQAGPQRALEANTLGEWSLKDMIAHLTSWRRLTADRLEAGERPEPPAYPWPANLDEEHDIDAINAWFTEQDRDKPLEQIVQESDATFDRVEQALATLAEAKLLTPGGVAWFDWTDDALGPAVMQGTWEHFHIDHEPDIAAWLKQDASSTS